MSSTGWKLDPAERAALLGTLPPAYPDAVASHVTLAMGVGEDAVPPPSATAEIVGQADDGAGVQAMVVRVNGSTDRPGGGTFHVTWSLDRAAGRTAIQSNDVIAARGWTPLPSPLTLTLIPALLP